MATEDELANGMALITAAVDKVYAGMTKHAKLWGEEDWIVNTEGYCGKILTLRKGWRCSLHFHLLKTETFYLSSGSVRLELGDLVMTMKPTDRVHVLPLVKHRFTGLEDSVIVEFSTHHDDADVIRLEPSRQSDV